MKTKISKVKIHLSYMAMLLCVLLCSCSETETMDDSGFALHYYSVTDIGPSVGYTFPAPSYNGGTPYDFAISGITLNGEAVEVANFSIDEETGVITFTPSQEAKASTGTYAISVSCYSNGGYFNFKDIVTVNMLLDAPEGVTMTPAEITVKVTDKNWWKASSQLTTETDTHISIMSYEIAEGPDKDLFTVSETGMVTFNEKNKDQVVPGTKYSVSLKLKTKAGDHLYPNAVTFDVVSAPYELVYVPNEIRVEENKEHASQQPTIKGSEGISYAIKSVVPTSDAFKIDKNTGVISLGENNRLPVGGVYKVSVCAENNYGSADFNDVYQVTIISFITPIDANSFKYSIAQDVYEEKGYTFSKDDGFVGDEALFSFGELQSAEIQEQIDRRLLTIDMMTGEVTLSEHNTLVPDTYEVVIKVANPKGEATAALKLDIKANPNKFAVLHYGNNLGLEPAEDYASQYEAADAKALKNLKLTPKTDLDGRKAKWEMIVKNNYPKGNKNYLLQGVTINENTGELDFSNSNTLDAMYVGLILVKATVGEGDLAYSVTTPVFVRLNAGKAALDYRPFALQVNPKTGGRSAVPVKAESDGKALTLDFRADFIFHHLSDMKNTDGLGNKDEGSILNQLWIRFYKTTGANEGNANFGAKKPVSALDISNGFNNPNNLGQTLCYIDQKDHSIVINPEKWVYDSGEYANGIFAGKVAWSNDGSVPNSNRFIPVVIWFDENFK